jgi:hypothetical protein
MDMDEDDDEEDEQDQENARPTPILFLPTIPTSQPAAVLEGLFGAYEGFKEVRVVAERGVAFVEYESGPMALVAKEKVEGVVVGGVKVKVSFSQI